MEPLQPATLLKLTMSARPVNQNADEAGPSDRRREVLRELEAPIPSGDALFHARYNAMRTFAVRETDISEKQLRALLRILEAHPGLFIGKEDQIGLYNEGRYCYTLYTGGARPIYQQPRKMAPEGQVALKKALNHLMKQGVIQPSVSDWGASVIMEPDEDGGWTAAFQYFALNSLTTYDLHPSMRDEEAERIRLKYSTHFSLLQVHQPAYHIRLSENSRHKTAFRTPLGQFEWRTLHPGLMAAGYEVKKALQETLQTMQPVTIVKDAAVLVHSRDFKTHILDLRIVAQRLQGAGWKVSQVGSDICRFKLTDIQHVCPPACMTCRGTPWSQWVARTKKLMYPAGDPE